jgi:hypothetical protein
MKRQRIALEKPKRSRQSARREEKNMKKTALGVLLAFGAAAAVFGPILLMRPASYASMADYRRIRKGMTVSEVKALLGEKPFLCDHPSPAAKWVEYRWHVNEGGLIAVGFDQNRKVSGWAWYPDEPPEGPVQRFFHEYLP